MSLKNSFPDGWLKPLVIQPYCQPHRETLIILHGRGDCADNFAPVVLRMPFFPSALRSEESRPTVSWSGNPSSGGPQSRRGQLPSTMQSVLPHTKFIFLTAPMRSCTMNNGIENYQWFDNFSLIDPEMRQDLQVAGLQETVEMVHRLLKEEIQASELLSMTYKLGLMGFSQGAAASLISGLLWNGESGHSRPNKTSLVAVVSMSGWLPFRRIFDEQVKEDHPVASQPEKIQTGVANLRHLLLPEKFLSADEQKEEGTTAPPTLPSSSIPAISILLCHGMEDNHVDPSLSRKAAKSLLDLGTANITTKEFPGLGHTVNGAEIGEVAEFLRQKFDETDSVV